MNLTNTIINDFPVTGKEQEISDEKISGLKIRISLSGTKTFYLVYLNGERKKKKLRIGKFGGNGLPAAKDTARTFKRKIDGGNDPKASG